MLVAEREEVRTQGIGWTPPSTNRGGVTDGDRCRERGDVRRCIVGAMVVAYRVVEISSRSCGTTGNR